nr:IS66 family insertion sequence element accessory protein TnpB [Nannocystis sp. RBIL2]
MAVGRGVIRVRGQVEAESLERVLDAVEARIPASVRIVVCTRPQDVRRSFDGLAPAARQVLGEHPQSGALFVFTNERD